MESQEAGDGINTPLLQKDSISYWMLTQKYSEEAKEISIDGFAFNEPVMRMVGGTRKFMVGFFNLHWHRLLDNGISVVAVDDQTGKVVGVFTGADLALKKVAPLRVFQLAMANPEAWIINGLLHDITAPLDQEHEDLIK